MARRTAKRAAAGLIASTAIQVERCQTPEAAKRGAGPRSVNSVTAWLPDLKRSAYHWIKLQKQTTNSVNDPAASPMVPLVPSCRCPPSRCSPRQSPTEASFNPSLVTVVHNREREGHCTGMEGAGWYRR